MSGRRPVLTPVYARRHTIAAMGASLTSNYAWGVTESLFWPSVLADNLYALGYAVRARNFATSGEKSYQMVARIACMTQYDVPEIAVIDAGYNDRNLVSVSGISRTGTIATATIATHGLTIGVPVNLELSGADQAAYNGVHACTPTTATQVTFAVDVGTVTPATGTILYQFDFTATTAYIEAMCEALVAAGVQRIVIMSRHYLNFTPSGDNSGGSPVYPPTGGALSLWMAQYNAYIAELALHPGKLAWCDLYKHMYDLLVDTPALVNDALAWFVAAGNVHYNAVGESHMADAVQATIAAQTGWLTSIAGAT